MANLAPDSMVKNYSPFSQEVGGDFYIHYYRALPSVNGEEDQLSSLECEDPVA